jgi:hypothetical protein
MKRYTHRGVGFEIGIWEGVWVYEIYAEVFGRGVIFGGYTKYRSSALAIAQKTIDTMKGGRR